MSKPLIVGNWKMNPRSLKEAESLFKEITKNTKDIRNVDIVICPPFPFLSIAQKIKGKKINLGAQNVFSEIEGAYTGEVSPTMLRDMKVGYVIVGHSERRSRGETNEIVNAKIKAVLKAKMTPILCIGETVRHDDGFYLATVKEQLTESLKDIPKNQISNVVIAYEPVWALSSTQNRRDATPHDFEEMKIYIRKVLTDMYTAQTASKTRIIYGGSVNKDNAEGFLKAGAMGLLPGKASLNPRNFTAILSIAASIK